MSFNKYSFIELIIIIIIIVVFVSASEQGSVQIDLVFEGLDTIAGVWLNGKSLGYTNNMFRRYVFPVKNLLKVEHMESIFIDFHHCKILLSCF